DTISPRLDAAGADVSKVFSFQGVLGGVGDGGTRLFSLGRDLSALQTVLKEYRPVLLNIDAVNSYIPSSRNSWKDTEIREVLNPLSVLAQDFNVAVVLNTHLNKGHDLRAIHRILGSVGYVGLARGALGVAPHPEDENKYVLARMKNNNANRKKGTPLVYELAETRTKEVSSIVCVVWHTTEQMAQSIDELLNAAVETKDRRKAQQVRRFFETVFTGDVKVLPSDTVREHARMAAMPWDAIKKYHGAYHAVKERKYQGAWWWARPDLTNEEAKNEIERIQAEEFRKDLRASERKENQP